VCGRYRPLAYERDYIRHRTPPISSPAAADFTGWSAAADHKHPAADQMMLA